MRQRLHEVFLARVRTRKIAARDEQRQARQVSRDRDGNRAARSDVRATGGGCVRMNLQPAKAAKAVDAFSASKDNKEKRLMKNQIEQNQNDNRYTEEPAKDVRHDLSSLLYCFRPASPISWRKPVSNSQQKVCLYCLVP